MAQLRVTLERSSIGNPKDQKDTVYSLGLHRMHQTVILPDNPSVRGMLHKVRHLVRVQPVDEPVRETAQVNPTATVGEPVETSIDVPDEESLEEPVDHSGVES